MCSEPFNTDVKKGAYLSPRSRIFYFTLFLVSQLKFYLLHFGNIANESIVVHVVAEALQLVKVPDEVLANPLEKEKHQRDER